MKLSNSHSNQFTPEKHSGQILAICGFSGSGKTTLLEELVKILVKRGLRVGAVKHSSHGFDIDQPGKDTDRLFRAGADVSLVGPNEGAHRWHKGNISLNQVLDRMMNDHDLVLVEGFRETPLPKVWLAHPDHPNPPAELGEVLAVLEWNSSRVDAMVRLIDKWLPQTWSAQPLCGGILLGGKSERMGTPKHLLKLRGITFLERVIRAMEPCVQTIALLGAGQVPKRCSHLPQLPDPPGIDSPIAGMLAAMRWAPRSAWIFAACDMPLISSEAVQWLISQRSPGKWAILPTLDGERVEPLFAVFERQSHSLIGELALCGVRAPRLIGNHDKAWAVIPPPELADAWINVNSQEELKKIRLK